MVIVAKSSMTHSRSDSQTHARGSGGLRHGVIGRLPDWFGNFKRDALERRLLAAFGLTGNYYYAVLLALGLSAAASYLVPNPLPFAVTVFVHGKGGIHDMPPKDSGEVVMELGGKVQRQQIGSNRTVDFKDIAPSHRG